MQSWFANLGDTVRYLLGHPSSVFEFGVLLLGAVVILTILAARAGRTAPEGAAHRFSAIPVTALGGLGLLLGIAWARDHFLPGLGVPVSRTGLLLTGCLVSVIVASISMGLFQRATLLSATTNWVVALLLAGMWVWFIRTTADSLSSGVGEIGKTKSRAQQMEAFLAKQ